MLVIGIDPGTATTGYGLIEENDNKELRVITYGRRKTEPDLLADKRLHGIHQPVSRLLRLHRPE